MTLYSPYAFIGTQWLETPPALWLVPFFRHKTPKATADTPAVPYILMCDQGNLGDCAQLPGATLTQDDLLTNGLISKTRIDFDKAAKDLLKNLTGFRLSTDSINGEVLHHDGSTLFAGPQGQRQTVVILIDMNAVLRRNYDCYRLPEIVQNKEKQGEPLPNTLTDQNKRRRHTGWVSLANAISGIRQDSSADNNLYSAERTPFFATNFALQRGGATSKNWRAPRELPMPGTVLYCLQLAAQKIYPNLSLMKDHPAAAKWVRSQHIRKARIAPELLAAR